MVQIAHSLSGAWKILSVDMGVRFYWRLFVLVYDPAFVLRICSCVCACSY